MLKLDAALKLAVAATIFWSTPSPALEYTLGAVADTVVVSSEPNTQVSSLNGSLASRRRIVSGVVDHEVWAFMKFVLPGLLPGTHVESAVFRGYYTGVSNQLTHELATVVSDAWNESTVTWNNKPGIATPGIATFRETNSTLVGQPFELDVTTAASIEYLGDGVLTLLMRPSEVNPILNGIHQIAFGSSNSIVGFKPALILKIVPEPAPGALLAAGVIALGWWRRASSRLPSAS